MKLPYFKFFPGDWQKDPNLRRCSHAAKGVLMDALCFAFETDERGYFITGGKPWSETDIAKAVGGNVDVTLKLISELLNKSVLKRRATDGAIYSAKMVREEEIRKKRASGGVLGGNPALKVNLPPNLSANHTPNHTVNHHVNMNMTSSPLMEKGSGEKPRFALPANEEEATQWCAAAGVPPDYAKKLFTQCEGTGWIDGVGRQIRSWSHYAKHRYTQEQLTRVTSGGAPTIHELRTVIQAKEKMMEGLKYKYCTEGPLGNDWKDQAKRQEYTVLKRELKELNEQLAKAL